MAVLIGAETTAGRAVSASIAAHLAAVSASLPVRGEAWADEARTLWRAAARLLGHDTAAASIVKCTAAGNERLTHLCSTLETENGHLRAECSARTTQLQRIVSEVSSALGRPTPHPFEPSAAGDLASAVKYLKDDVMNARDLRIQAEGEVECLTREHAVEVARLTDALATAKADLEEAQRSPVSSGPTTAEVEAAVARTVQCSSVTPSHHHRSPEVTKSATLVTDIRKAALDAGAKDCTVFVGPGDGDLAVVVELREGALLGDIRIALESVMPGTHYKLRRVGRPGDRCGHRNDGDPAACDHCSLKG